MSKTIKNEDGTEEEVFTADEIEEQKQEAIEQFKAENPDKTDELNELQEKLTEAEEALAKAGNKDVNIGNLRKAKDEAEKKLTDFDIKLEEKITQVKREVIEGVNKDHYSDNLKALAGEDDELQKKIELEYNQTLKGVVPTSKAEITKKLQDAYLLATRPAEVDALSSTVISSGGVGRVNIKSDKKFSNEEKELANKMSQAGGLGTLTDKDFK